MLMATATTPASAQPLGVFRWQQQPFCNVLNLAVTATPSGFRMEGTDDQCGGVPASAVRHGVPKADGTVGVGLTLVLGVPWRCMSMAASIPAPGSAARGPIVWGGTAHLSSDRAPEDPCDPWWRRWHPDSPTGQSWPSLREAVTKAYPPRCPRDVGTPNDAAALHGRFGGALAFNSPAPAGVRGDSTANVGVMGLTDTGHGVVGGAEAGVGVQGYATSGANSIAVQAVHVSGGTALDVRNGALMVSGAVRTAIFFIALSDRCTPINDPLLNGDPLALVFVTLRSAGYIGTVEYVMNKWNVCTVGPEGAPPKVIPMSVLAIKHGPL